MKLRALIIAAAAAALTVSMSMTAMAAMSFEDWYYARNGYYPEGSPIYWYDTADYSQYASYVINQSGNTSYTNSSSDYVSYANIEDPYWSGTYAKWEIEGYASKYQVRVYREGTRVGSKNSSSRSQNLSEFITSAGYYIFEVRAYNAQSGWSDWVESDDQYFSGRTTSTNSSSGPVSTSPASASPVVVISSAGTSIAQSQWMRATDGSGRWWYRHFDGSYSKNAWESIDGKWYYFDASGWMKTGWLNVGGANYYLGIDGAMVTGNKLIDGVTRSFDASGKLLG